MPWHKEVTINTNTCSRQLSNRKNTNGCDRQLATRHSDIDPHVLSEHDYFEWVHCTSTSSESGANQFPEGLYFMNALWQSETKNTVHHQILKIITSVHCACICRIQTKLTLGSHEHQFTGNWLSRAIVHFVIGTCQMRWRARRFRRGRAGRECRRACQLASPSSPGPSSRPRTGFLKLYPCLESVSKQRHTVTLSGEGTSRWRRHRKYGIILIYNVRLTAKTWMLDSHLQLAPQPTLITANTIHDFGNVSEVHFEVILYIEMNKASSVDTRDGDSKQQLCPR